MATSIRTNNARTRYRTSKATVAKKDTVQATTETITEKDKVKTPSKKKRAPKKKKPTVRTSSSSTTARRGRSTRITRR